MAVSRCVLFTFFEQLLLLLMDFQLQEMDGKLFGIPMDSA